MGTLRTLESYLPDRVVEPLTRGALLAATSIGARRIPVFMVEGLTRIEKEPATMLLAGQEPWIRYLPESFFEATPSYRPIGSFPVWALMRALETYGASCDLIVARVDRWSAQQWLADPDFLRVPEWIGTRIPVPADLDRLLKSGGSIKRDMTLVRRHGFEASCDASDEAFELFYQRVYVAFTRARHGDETFMRPERDLRRRLRRGGILWVANGAQRTAGVLYERHGDELSLLALGTLDGNLALVKQGAIAALYYFTIRLARELGCSTIDLRGCRPCLTDGLLNYKKKWGAIVCEKPETYYDLLLRWSSATRVVRSFFAHSPLIFRESGGFSAITGDPTDAAHSLGMEGIQRVYRLTEQGRIPLSNASA